jgi:putative membrane protein
MSWYDFAKAMHVISVICWFAVLFYLPRLFVYHAMTEDTAGKERFKVMERKLFRGIGRPSMIATIVFGAWTTYLNWPYYSVSTWFWIKIALVLCLVFYHEICGVYIKKFAEDLRPASHVFFRYFNELPVLLLIAIVFLVITKRPA